ncbi:monovalent cation:H+ antiporter, CPA1 family [Pseudomonas citronellolis]|uniref:Monovalent cation:H+ antiporter, CPA1 family n=1 Tax=Pseudomonas citronellolis TaxID=53408 RepID=A0AAQ1HJY1_9PSED|nr:sodium:proton antiporter [Pseudomonas citronellolis]MCP1645852.1 CPA1 family monovalent cation:H+ antiporter [Pseudomonas citronellolis]MCP1668724.1 CPA1 family monovalent cation:H+ antiporter [Pseudomonas citronellolis]MCP1700236.1 CPA1 family monovalent cation:H+ antiporter [Pseudomonas citronellolis]MCP1706600.1 CPA1 family monovalent cation:H+ antiporter [Pseudomonas citronellolis]MCP1800390.1 CPA1 family monovalent cation:H+ antiporter [Pseudomonas citronellolis]
MLDLAAAFITLTTLLTYVNYRFVRLPPTIGVMATALVFSLLAQGLSMAGYPVLEVEMQQIIRRIDFSEVLMTWFLPALLFAGALHVNLSDLRNYKWPIGLLATFGVLIATTVIGYLAYYTFALFGWHVDFIYCLLFGALISPTDPIAVLGILRSAGAPKPLATTIVGESLFNDGTAVVVFTILLGILMAGETPTVSATAWLFLQEAVGGVLFGAALGYGVFLMMRGIDQYQVEVMLTLALVIGGAALAARLHVSAPIAMVVAGLIIGNQARQYAMSDETRRYIDKFWELIDEILNALLFALIGLELLLLPFNWLHVVAAFALGGAVLASRLLTVAPAILVLRQTEAGRRQVPGGTIRILVWGGLRGGVSVALALSLPLGEQRDLILSLTYVVVLVSILLQGLSIGPLVRTIYRGAAPAADDGH